ncbi:uncharacterized protein [Montipora foliosa]|uniref:uncharacterized protein n=1 Tax=Montipora foliosa TaxID=591990 RepID=UPI0035F12594
MLLTQALRVDYEELCELHVLGLADSPSGDQGVVCDEFEEQLQRRRGCYETGLPWKGNHSPWPNNKDGSLRRLISIVRELEKNGSIDDYNAVIQEQLAEGIVECIPNSVEGREFHIPHKRVQRETLSFSFADASNSIRTLVVSLSGHTTGKWGRNHSLSGCGSDVDDSVKAVKVYALLEDASNTTFVTTQVERELGIDGVETCLDLSTIPYHPDETKFRDQRL